MMRLLRRISVLFLTLAMLLMLSVAAQADGPLVDNGTPVGEEVPSAPPFVDVRPDSWYAEPVMWAIEQGVTSGTSETTFSPDDTCSNAQVLTFLWRACESPDTTGNNPFEDITVGSYYYKAALWAYENGMVDGTSFQPDKPCSRSMAVDYMWKQAGRPKASSELNFDDVNTDSDYAQAVAWALDMGITNGTSDTTFSPANSCTRAQIITFLYRGLGENAVSGEDYLDIIIR